MSEEAATLTGALVATCKQIRDWVQRFTPYRLPPTPDSVVAWLSRFAPEHQSIARRILDRVDVIPELEIQKGYKRALAGLSGWSRTPSRRRGRWYFAGVGGPGESGQAMLRLFREANHMTRASWNSLFVSLTELPDLGLSAYDSVVFVDDCAGTGNQVVRSWPVIAELVASEAKCYLLLTVATTKAKERIGEETELIVRANTTLGPDADVYSAECGAFNQSEKSILDKYGKIAWRDHPRGFGACGLCIVLSHKTPNNSLPILHANHDAWRGLFPRNLMGTTSYDV